MLTFKEFYGINNVLHPKRMKPSEFVRAVNVDVGLGKELARRQGYSQASPDCHKNLWQAEGFMLATCDGNLTAIWPNDSRTVLYESLGVERVWYCNLPDGRTAFSNGLIQGITDGLVVTGWGVQIPDSVGTLSPITGSLYAGQYQYQLAYARTSDGREGGPAYSANFTVATGGIRLIGLPVRDGHSIRVYLTSLDGGEAYYAGTTATDEFEFAGANHELTIPARLDMTYPCPATATISAMSRGRVLVAEGNVLYASRVGQPEVFDLRRDFKQFTAPITLIQPVNDGVYVGTESELAFLAGTEFDKLQLVRVMHGRVALGSGVTVPGEKIKIGDGVGRGQAMICLVDGGIVAGFDGGSAIRLTENRYKTTATEVAATYRESNGIPQYLAIPLDVEIVVVPPVVFSPLDLFANDEQGAWYDPSDLSTMFQDSAGTTPVTADGQPVGLILDKSKGLVLGSETIVDTEFNDTSKWEQQAGWVVSGGVATYTAGTPSFIINTAPPNPSIAGKLCEIVITVTSGQVVLLGSQFIEQVTLGVGTHTVYMTPNNNAAPIYADAAAVITSFSVKTIAGNHASQATAAKRPLYKTSGLAKYNDYDVVDDVLNTAFPASLGSSCTVAKAVVGGSPAILTGQTIGTTWTESTDNAGLIIIDRALTSQETTDLTAWLTEKGATA